MIPVYMEARALPVTLPRILAAAARVPGGAEILVAAGPSTDGSRELAARLLGPVTHRILDVPPGKFEALRHAAREARAPALVLVDADVTVSEDAFALLAGQLEAGAHICQARGQVARQAAPASIAGWLERWQSHMDEARHRLRSARPECLWNVSGGLYALRAGWFPDRALVPALDDISVGLHVRRLGGRLGYEPRATWAYQPPRTPVAWLRQKVRTRRAIARLCRLEPAARVYYRDLLAEYARPGHGGLGLRASVVAQEQLVRLLGRILHRVGGVGNRWHPVASTKEWSQTAPPEGA